MMHFMEFKISQLATTAAKHAAHAWCRRVACALLVWAHAACVDWPYQTCPQTGLICQEGFECSLNGDFCTPLQGCGNGKVDDGEACDDGNRVSGDGCSSECTSREVCGNAYRDKHEQCDDGNVTPEDGCSPTCQLENCGNGAIDPYETCDDGNTHGDDGCSADCLSLEVCGNGYIDTSRGENCDDGNTIHGDGCSATCKDENCGNRLVDPNELCDDGNTDNGDGCSDICLLERCGDGVVRFGETCDDSNNANGDGCSADCRSDETCGNGILDSAADEACDDGNTEPGDGCSADCLLERCGDGIVQSGETCDDDNNADRDGCSADCLSDETCGNGNIDPAVGEVCDDGNTTNGDGCEADCTLSDTDVEVRALAAGGRHTCALLATGAVRCWGRNNVGQLGHGNTDDVHLPARANNVELGAPAQAITAGGEHSCALLVTGEVRCWGRNGLGELGQGNTRYIGDNERPDAVGPVALGERVVAITAGNDHTCALLVTGKVHCWGLNNFGQLGYPDYAMVGDNEVPEGVGPVSVGDFVVALAAGSHHTCALLVTNRIRCWGRNSDGQLGYGNTNDIGDDELPSEAGDVSVGDSVIAIAAGSLHTCALLVQHAIRCWGANQDGQVAMDPSRPGNDRIGDVELPSTLASINVGGPVDALALGARHTCARLATANVLCWGRASGGWLGYGEDDGELVFDHLHTHPPVGVGGLVVALTASHEHTCALLDTGAVRCWGINEFGELGYGNTTIIGDNETPATVSPVVVKGNVAVATLGRP